MKVLVLGGGSQGPAAAFDLVQRAQVERVVVADRDLGHPAPFLAPQMGARLEFRALDARDPAQVREAMQDADAVLCALPYTFNLQMAALAVEAGAHYCDLGGNTEIVERQRGLDARAVGTGVSVLPDCGVAPGMVNILAQGGIDALDRVHSVRMFFGGLPQKPKPPLNYQIVYSMQGVLDYYTTPSVVLENGEIANREALSEVEELLFPEPVGKLEAFHTAGGASTMPYRYRGRIPRFEYKTLRYPGHAHHPRSGAPHAGEDPRRRLRGVAARSLHRGGVAQAPWRPLARSGGSARGGEREEGRSAEDDPLRAARPERRGARHRGDDAHHRLFARSDHTHAGGRLRARARRPHSRRGDPGGRVHRRAGDARGRHHL